MDGECTGVDGEGAEEGRAQHGGGSRAGYAQFTGAVSHGCGTQQRGRHSGHGQEARHRHREHGGDRSAAEGSGHMGGITTHPLFLTDNHTNRLLLSM
ncbi:hypothetical protein P8A21_28055 [Streptomyces poriferorum]|uniref:Uncharacterized protein n=1 Tax=Streptomyces poriferorum TaxID=2798799 RepID=A0ABY9IPG5_9ACTN|nr:MULTISPECIES: hypothetical protein [unclassified Streptomyces]MDP5314877.1 hypothetical protein [Streptomyces sp. Alt4]WLQ51103.1 hypothetical protein P8A21_28055 [Streptomyces sp. Alt1]WLQ56234.1 hypothetical protein P8A19_12645 [Streptomyces sp. Alt2]